MAKQKSRKYSGVQCWYNIERSTIVDGREQCYTIETGEIRGETVQTVYDSLVSVVAKYEKEGGEKLSVVPVSEIEERLNDDSEFTTVIECDVTPEHEVIAILEFSYDDGLIWRKTIQLRESTNENISE